MEMKVVISLIEELRSKMALDLDTTPSFDRSLGSQARPKKKSEFLLVGCCNSKEEAEILRNRGRVVCTIFSKDWRINRTSVASMANAIRKQIEDEDPGIIILELLDNSVFYCKQEDGSRVIPKKGADDIYHIEGELLVCSRDVQAEQFNLLRPIFEAAESRRVVWTVPTPRYIMGSCCDDSHAEQTGPVPAGEHQHPAGLAEEEHERLHPLHFQEDDGLRPKSGAEGHEQ
jgi:hypothetical protein